MGDKEFADAMGWPGNTAPEQSDFDKLRALEDNDLDKICATPRRRKTDSMDNLPASRAAFEFLMAGYDSTAATAAAMMREVRVPEPVSDNEGQEQQGPMSMIFSCGKPHNTEEMHAGFAQYLSKTRLSYALGALQSKQFMNFLLREAQGTQYGWADWQQESDHEE